MHPFNEGKILSYYEDAITIKNGGMPKPRMALIYPTYRCDLDCKFCLYKEMNNIGKQPEMTLPEFTRLIDELKATGVKAIEMCGGGDPLLYPHLDFVIKYIADSGLELGIFTSGSTLDKHYKLIIDNATYVRISLDTICGKTFAIMKGRKPDILFKILNNIATTAEYREKTKSTCSLGLKVVLSKYNINEVEALIGFMHHSKFDYIQFKSVCSDESELSDIQKEAAQEFLDAQENNKIRGGVLKSKLEVPCIMSPVHTMIDAYGDVYICCYFQYRTDKMRIGNIHAQSFNEIWYSDKHKEVIKNINMAECDKYDCRFHGYNKVMRDVIDKNKIHINFI